jgi:methyl-accepting chemotaxis protein
MKIRARMLVLLGSAVAMGVVSSAVLLEKQEDNAESYEKMINGPISARAAARSCDVLLKSEVIVWKNLLIRGHDPANLARYSKELAEKHAETRERLEKVAASLDNRRASEALRQAMALHQKMKGTYDAATDMLRKGGAKGFAAADALSKEMDQPVSAEIQAAVKILNDQAEATRVAQREFLVAEQNTLTVTLFIGFGAVALVILWMVNRSIIAPLVEMTRQAAAMAQGDMARTINHRSNDELGMLADSFRTLLAHMGELSEAADAIGRGNLSIEVVPKSEKDLLSHAFMGMSGSLKNLLREVRALTEAAERGELGERGNALSFGGAYSDLVKGINRILETVSAPIYESQEVLERIAQRDLTARMTGEYAGDFGRIKMAVNTAAGNLHDGMVQVSSAAEQVASAAAQIAAGSQSVAQGASEQARSLGQAASSLRQMSEVTQHNVQSTGQAASLSGEAKSASGSGMERMAEMISAMDKIRDSAQGTATIIRDINEIAFQTNLLALNAAVEAARAGDAGRGFAVVAEEVRSLALRSKEAAKKTETLIQESMQLATSGETLSKEVGTNLQHIATSVDKVSSIIAEINAAGAEQARGISSTEEAVAEVDKVTQQNAASAEESASAGEQLSSQAAELSALVAKFKINARRSGKAGGRSAVDDAAMPQLAANNPSGDIRAF